MNSALSKLFATLLASAFILLTSGCSTIMENYSFNGVPLDRLYAESNQQTTDVPYNNGVDGWCVANPLLCIIGATVVIGGVVFIVKEIHDKPVPVPGGGMTQIDPPS
ncbi:MAG: hypothetical protein ABUK11_07735 [Mariprofundaceae bacterium]